MPISSVIITYEDSAEGQSAGGSLAADPRIELGTIVGRRQAAVIETHTKEEDKSLWKWINDFPGVTHVDVVFVSLMEDEDPEHGSPEQPFERIPHAHEVQR